MLDAPSTTKAFVCSLCGCVCDDLRLTIAQGRITQTAHACRKAETWLLGQGGQEAAAARVDGALVPLEQALDRAARILRAARAPLILASSRCGVEGLRAAVALADRIGAVIDGPASSLPLTLAMQEVGLCTCSFGEVRQRADLVIFWGADPVVSHPRLLERIVQPAVVDPLDSRRVIRDRSRRTMIVVDKEKTTTAESADRFFLQKAGQSFEAIWALRGLVREPSLEPANNDALGMAPADLHELARLMKACRFGVIFFGRGLGKEGPRSVEALLRLVAELNDRTRFYAQSLLSDGPGGADNVLAWQTGYPCAVDLSRGFPRSNPGEFSAARLLANAEVDACLLVGGDVLADLPSAAASQLERVPTIRLEAAGSSLAAAANVRIITAVVGVHVPGTVFRMDGVALPLHGVLTESHPRTETILAGIGDRLNGGPLQLNS